MPTSTSNFSKWEFQHITCTLMAMRKPSSSPKLSPISPLPFSGQLSIRNTNSKLLLYKKFAIEIKKTKKFKELFFLLIISEFKNLLKNLFQPNFYFTSWSFWVYPKYWMNKDRYVFIPFTFYEYVPLNNVLFLTRKYIFFCKPLARGISNEKKLFNVRKLPDSLSSSPSVG